ncbi:hypothetical protein WN55_06562 [Dufourea novaeangliae]|uniref:Uncharacterized protein n=1 Tax=Dufourea novaeangliae TaxID=178035 RepID=A0A154PRU0_DUFNO|nr:hypothetical protein WN55_06562 [Dufourea novaeangliae]
MDEPIMESTRFHTVDENSLGRSVGINKFVHPSTPSRDGAGAGAVFLQTEHERGSQGRSQESRERHAGTEKERRKGESQAANGWTDGHEADSIGLISPSEPNYPPNGQIYCPDEALTEGSLMPLMVAATLYDGPGPRGPQQPPSRKIHRPCSFLSKGVVSLCSPNYQRGPRSYADRQKGVLRLENRPQLAVREGGHTLATKRKVEGLQGLCESPPQRSVPDALPRC